MKKKVAKLIKEVVFLIGFLFIEHRISDFSLKYTGTWAWGFYFSWFVVFWALWEDGKKE